MAQELAYHALDIHIELSAAVFLSSESIVSFVKQTLWFIGFVLDAFLVWFLSFPKAQHCLRSHNIKQDSIPNGLAWWMEHVKVLSINTGVLGIGLLLLAGLIATDVHVWGPGGLDRYVRRGYRRTVHGRGIMMLMSWIGTFLNGPPER